MVACTVDRLLALEHLKSSTILNQLAIYVDERKKGEEIDKS